jgi:DNA-directed RNA polymerase subunit RPC12/RpoP
MDTQSVEVGLSGRYIKWYERRGYKVPTHAVQCWANKDGRRVKNGIEKRVKEGTKIVVSVKDLPPESNAKVEYVCETCGEKFKTQWKIYRKKMSGSCKSCAAKKGFKGGCQDYWFDRLIKNNPNAKCDISGISDKRFLQLHHLLSRKDGGKNIEENFMILSANLHTAFHRWAGGNKIATPEQYAEFRATMVAEGFAGG